MDDGDGVLGSTAILGAVDTAIVLKWHSVGSRTIQRANGDGDDPEEAVRAYDKGTGVVSLGGSIAEDQMQDTRHSVLDAVTNCEEPTEADSRAPGNHARGSTARRALMDEGAAERVGAGKKGAPYKYKLAKQRWGKSKARIGRAPSWWGHCRTRTKSP